MTTTMATFKISLSIVFLLIVKTLTAQQTPMTLGNVKMAFLNSSQPKNYLNNNRLKFVDVALKTTDSSITKFSFKSIPPTYYTQHLGMMCKEELKLEKIIKFPIKIRLGSKEQVDYLEGKFYQH